MDWAARMGVTGLVELYRTNDPVLMSWMRARLAAINIEALVLDQHTSILEGSISAIQSRIMVDDDDLPRARQVLREADEIARGVRDPLD